MSGKRYSEEFKIEAGNGSRVFSSGYCAPQILPDRAVELFWDLDNYQNSNSVGEQLWLDKDAKHGREPPITWY